MELPIPPFFVVFLSSFYRSSYQGRSAMLNQGDEYIETADWTVKPPKPFCLVPTKSAGCLLFTVCLLGNIAGFFYWNLNCSTEENSKLMMLAPHPPPKSEIAFSSIVWFSSCWGLCYNKLRALPIIFSSVIYSSLMFHYTNKYYHQEKSKLGIKRQLKQKPHWYINSKTIQVSALDCECTY